MKERKIGRRVSWCCGLKSEQIIRGGTSKEGRTYPSLEHRGLFAANHTEHFFEVNCSVTVEGRVLQQPVLRKTERDNTKRGGERMLVLGRVYVYGQVQ